MRLKKAVILLTDRLFAINNFIILFKLVILITIIHLLLVALNNKILQSKQAEEALSLLENKWNCFIEECNHISNGIGNKIINSTHIKNDAAYLSFFLNTIQYWSTFSEKNSIFQASNLIWFNDSINPTGALGLLSPNIFKNNMEFIDTCKSTPNKLIISKPYKNKFYTAFEKHIEICTSFYKEKTYVGSLIIHVSPDAIKSIIFDETNKTEFHPNTIAISDSKGNVIITNNEKLNHINEQIKHTKQNSTWFSKFHEKLFYKTTTDLSYMLLVEFSDPLFQLKHFCNVLKLIPYTTMVLFLVMGLMNCINNVILYNNKKIIKLILNLTKKFSPPHEAQVVFNTNRVQFYFWLKRLFKNLNLKLVEFDKIKINLKELNTNYAKLELEQKQTVNTKELLKIAYGINLKIKRSISEQLKSMLLGVITKLEEPIRTCKNLDMLPSTVVAELVNMISKDLKDIFNLKIQPKRELIDPMPLIDDTVKSLMLLAFLREVTITYSMENNLTPIYIDQLKFQLAINGIVSQAIDLTHKGGNISLKLNRVTDNDSSYLKILIQDDSYSSTFSTFSQNCFLICDSITMSNIVQLVESEGGRLTIEHHSNYGKTITIMYPYSTTNNEKMIKYDNVYSLR